MNAGSMNFVTNDELGFGGEGGIAVQFDTDLKAQVGILCQG